MPIVLLLTAAELPHDDLETGSVAEALTGLGIQTEIVPWTEPGLADRDANLAVIRTTWDYTTRLPEFLAVLAALQMPVVNRLDVVRWNSHKGYLADLADHGVPAVPTWLYRSADLSPDLQLPDVGAAELIVKPAVSAGGRLVSRFASTPSAPSASAPTVAALAHLRQLLVEGDALVQPFQPDIVAGERSLIFLAGAFSHAVRKTPEVGDFRVQERFGGANEAHVPDQAELAVAEAALAAVPGGRNGLLYARVDLVGPEQTPLVMELELIEPELFLTHHRDSAHRLAAGIDALL